MTFVLVIAGSAFADTTANASYVVSLGGNILATANFKFVVSGASYDLDLNATVSGLAQLVAAGTAKASSDGAVTNQGLVSNAFNLVTHSGGEEVKVQVTFANSNVSAFVVTPPIEAALRGPVAPALRALEARLGREIAIEVEPNPDRAPFDIVRR
jgi:ABC-type uncharacterized transport system permease subunit